MNRTDVVKKSPWLVVLLAVAILVAFYGRMVWVPGEYLFSGEGDGIKNYYTYSWHVAYDSGYTHFGGMNFPYGEHVVFTDNQPLLSNSCMALKGVFPGITDHLISIHNALLFISLVLAVLFLYKLFFALTSNHIYALMASLSVGFLSPQITRFHGHFALAYCFVVPLAIWWLYCFFRRPSLYLSTALGMLLLLLLFIHVYYLVILGGLVVALWFVYLVRKQWQLSFTKAMLHLCLQVVLPFILYFVWLKWTDTVQDRPSQPYGIVEYAANWEGLLLPLDYAWFKPFKELLGVRKVSVESIAYAGFPMLVFVLSGLVLLLLKPFRKKQEITENKIKKEPFIQNLLWAVVIIFCYAAFIPYLFDIPAVSQYLGLLKQFRSLGRLLWIVYYGLNIYLFFLLFSLSRKHKIYSIAAYLSFAVMAIEGIGLNTDIERAIRNPKPETYSLPEGVDRQHYAAILPLPFFHEGSENIGATPPGDAIVRRSFQLSLQTGIPLYAVKMSRTSLQQTLQQLELAFEITQLPRPLDQEGAFLVLKQRSVASTIPYLNEREIIYRDKDIELYALTRKTLQQMLERNSEERRAAVKDSIQTPIAYLSFDDKAAEKTFMGKGALYGSTNDTLKLWDAVISEDTLHISFWMYANMEGLPQLKLLLNDGNKEERVQVTQHVDAVKDQWMRVSYTCPVKGKLSLRLIKENAAKGQKFFIDELLVRSLKKDYVVEKEGRVMINNRPYPLP